MTTRGQQLSCSNDAACCLDSLRSVLNGLENDIQSAHLYIFKAEGVSVIASGGRICWFSSITFHEDVGDWISLFHLSISSLVRAFDPVLCDEN